jgi:hypothetical protein
MSKTEINLCYNATKGGKEILKEKGHSWPPMHIYYSLTDNTAINENTIYPLNFPSLINENCACKNLAMTHKAVHQRIRSITLYICRPLTLQRDDLNSTAVSLLRYFFQPPFKFWPRITLFVIKYMWYKHETFTKMILKDGFISFLFNNIGAL